MKLYWYHYTIAALAAGYGLVYLTWPEIVTKTVVEYKDREVVKYVDKVVEVEKVEERIIKVYVEKPDGTKSTTTIEEKVQQQAKTEVQIVEKEKVVEKIVVTEKALKRYSLGVLAIPETLTLLPRKWEFQAQGVFWVNSSAGVLVGSSLSEFKPFVGLYFNF